MSVEPNLPSTLESLVQAGQATPLAAEDQPMPSTRWRTHAEILWNDFRFAARSLWKARAFTVVAVVTLALGIGASTAIFSVIDNILLDPFPYADSERFMVVMIHNTEDGTTGGREGFSGPEFFDYVNQNHVFDRIIGDLSDQDVTYTTRDGAQRLSGDFVAPNTFEFFGMPALYGRALEKADYEIGAAPVFVLRHKAWTTYFNGDPAILNKTFVLNGIPRTLIGIMPPRFAFGNADVWIPQTPSRASQAEPAGQETVYWDILAHLKPGVTIPQAEADLNVLAHQLSSAYPKDYPKNFTVQVQSLIDQVVGPFRSTLLIVLAAVSLLLLIGCANVANLLLARATTREKEFAIRASLGASRWRIIRQLLLESFLLAVCGAMLGSVLAWAGLKALIALTPPETIPAEAAIRMNGTVLLFTLGVAAVTALLFGLVPALQASRRDFNDSLRDTGKGVSGSGAGHTRFRNAVVVLEVSVSLMLLVGAGLLMRSFAKLREVSFGFSADHVLIARLPLPEERYKTTGQLSGFFRPLIDRLRSLPGVVDAAETSSIPPYGTNSSEIDVLGTPHSAKWIALYQLGSQGIFNVLRMRFLEGRPFTADEVNRARKVVVINEAFRRRYLENDNVIGRRIHVAELEQLTDPVHDAVFEVIGMVADAKNQGLQEAAQPEIWIPYNVTSSGARNILVRTANDPLRMTNTIRQEIWAVDPSVAQTSMGTLEQLISANSYAQPRFAFLLITVFASIGLILVSVGVYSVISYTTARRTQEIGIRIALGAAVGDVERLVIGKGVRLVAIGIALGLVGSFALSGVVASQLWGVSPHDALTLVAVPAVLLLVGVLACWIPARRATHVSPVVALRYE